MCKCDEADSRCNLQQINGNIHLTMKYEPGTKMTEQSKCYYCWLEWICYIFSIKDHGCRLFASGHWKSCFLSISPHCTMWLSFSKNGIRDSNQISTTAPIFLQFNYFRQNLEENVTFTFYFFSFASNFPCKILWDNKNIDANICIFQIPFWQWWVPRIKKLFWGVFFSTKWFTCVPNFNFIWHPQQVFCQ